MRSELIDKVQGLMEEKDLEAFAVTRGKNMEYLSGIHDVSGVLIITPDDWKFLVSKFFRYSAEKISNTRVYRDPEERTEMMEDIFSEIGVEKVASDMEGEFADVAFERSDLLKEARSIKTDREIEKIKRACKIGDSAFNHLEGFFEVGRSEWELASSIELFFRQEGSYNSFDPLVHFNTVEPHRPPGDRKAEKGDLVLVDLGCKYKGYCSDMTRMIPNSCRGESKELIEAVSEIQRRSLEMVESGAEASEIAESAQDQVEDLGFSVDNHYLHSLGHGVGVAIHEAPNMSVESESVLEEGMVVTIEPGLYVPDIGGVRIEDTVVVKENGFERLTKEKRIYER